MTALATMLGIVLGPFVVTWLVLRLLRALSRRAGGAAAGEAARRPVGQEPPLRLRAPGQSGRVERLRHDLSQLEREYRRVLAAEPPDPSRLCSLGLQYDATLAAVCVELGLPAPGPPPLDGVVRLEVEAALAQRGLCW
ncbi:MAG: hypothetical protein M3P93_12895 [Actinomycetota bacterium]|nr:hypothetical protein [Actinomycetota bacterium]